MPADNVIVALIADALGGRTLARRTAASLLLDLLRTKDASDELNSKVETVSGKLTGEVAKELRALIEEHGLGAAR